MKILIVEDEDVLAQNLNTSLSKQGYRVEWAKDFFEAQEKLDLYSYDCILLDIGLPNGNGLDLLKQLKKEGVGGNVIIISAKNALDDKVEGLALGADDYLTKPFHVAELNARINAVLRRKTFGGKEHIKLGNSVLDVTERTFIVNGEPCALNRKEFDVLLFFVSNKNRLVTKSGVAEHVWGDFIDQADNFDFVYYQVKNLRKKLKECHSDISISSVYGVGYKLELL